LYTLTTYNGLDYVFVVNAKDLRPKITSLTNQSEYLAILDFDWTNCLNNSFNSNSD